MFDFMQKIRPIWYEEAGSEPLISGKDLKQWFRGTPVNITCRTLTYMSPHMLVLLPLSIAKKLLYGTDKVFARIPWLNKHGGLIIGIGKT